ncbi:MAG: RNA polymerase sigma factor, sigma-70 family [Parcubacteria group bacterium GW2011_GWB1_45_7]|uniref:Sigma-70 region 4 domain protein n=2 Tax=Parcubacteria group TaxID=1794811 RepID=A0A0H4TP27_9BACT|nr:sigma-70 region 4 domain protein [uncultured Parcubacteria bacterium Rifle_16ft_4_minimus_37647]KKU11707.1 MAG: RNA polymerase sigma factor, sigma-70 family [Parcubacteria group bacterium GW2011_GWB1_45_7]OGY57835.1 MAG: hypothetical protein A3C03_01470 [Candidatus Colwellbacteria bacterium RIFCSPHIGHO2_02_FULL_45_17]OGY62212.1 MAG: hypothetical protein A3G58_00100 [Candidatus Colwellbacteria bacterium RIFCSPLOWO2_12_FULL_46_17]
MVGVNIDINGLINEALLTQDERAKRIVMGRYGLGTSGRKTLAALGGEYGLTRERVRQIQAAALEAIRGEIKEHKEAVKFLKAIEGYLKDVGHLRRGDLIAKDFNIGFGGKEDTEALSNKLHFLADALGWPFVEGGNEDWHVVWYSKKDVYDTAKKLVGELLKTKEQDFDKFLKSASGKFRLPEPQIVNHLLISKRFGIGPYGDMGADHWVRVNPKTVRDKIYIVLDKSKEPMHFTEIAANVNSLSGKKRAAATVHNELIKDPRFVLVGRGTYAINV